MEIIFGIEYDALEKSMKLLILHRLLKMISCYRRGERDAHATGSITGLFPVINGAAMRTGFPGATAAAPLCPIQRFPIANTAYFRRHGAAGKKRETRDELKRSELQRCI